MNIFEKRIEESKKYIPAINRAFAESYFSNYDREFLLTEEGRTDKDNHVFQRYDNALRHVVPWIAKHIELDGAEVLEIGCGTGSSTAALAHFVKRIDGYDIDPRAVKSAEQRLEIMGLDNARLHVVSEDTLIRRITGDAAGKFDIILLFAVLEHQTIEERLETITTCWDLLRDDGVMAVIDTPNILHYFDLHTSKLPFLHMLPTRIYAKYAAYSPRAAFARPFADENEQTDAELDLRIARWGRGASYHDFELALGKDYRNYLVAEGFEPEILAWFVCTPEEEMLRWYVQYKQWEVPLAFTRCVLNFILKKHSRPPAQNERPAPPPPLSLFDPATLERVGNLEQQLKNRNELIEKIYNSTTWRTGNMLAAPYRKLCSIFKW